MRDVSARGSRTASCRRCVTRASAWACTSRGPRCWWKASKCESVCATYMCVYLLAWINYCMYIAARVIYFSVLCVVTVPMAYSGWRTRFVVLFVLALLHQLLWALPVECQSTPCFYSWGRYGKALSCAWKLDRLCSVTACVSLNLQPICRFVPTNCVFETLLSCVYGNSQNFCGLGSVLLEPDNCLFMVNEGYKTNEKWIAITILSDVAQNTS